MSPKQWKLIYRDGSSETMTVDEMNNENGWIIGRVNGGLLVVGIRADLVDTFYQCLPDGSPVFPVQRFNP